MGARLSRWSPEFPGCQYAQCRQVRPPYVCRARRALARCPSRWLEQAAPFNGCSATAAPGDPGRRDERMSFEFGVKHPRVCGRRLRVAVLEYKPRLQDCISWASPYSLSPPPPAKLFASPFSSNSCKPISPSSGRRPDRLRASDTVQRCLSFFAAFRNKDLGNNQPRNAVSTSFKWWLRHCTTTLT